ncbi:MULTISPECIES: alpha/beta fold hydrolase [Arthrobacter]|uniref:Alpha/beta hydrolase n=1 Tax=Arthrobacter terricola TaxID=2547396 RepID=A0A4R5KT51_9MICC|nr:MULTISPECIES: alpha/beta hydrolase [Arthrobacter]MBT8159843.1 alpha/beta hydrolase [Arthrobacter sp. GN70]TDF99069.1 alpha/beta hydrolase [Arthrobacter terricola]
MSEFANSKDGTRIAYERHGDGPAVILVGGAMQFRGFDPTTVEMGKQLAAQGFTVLNYDRRGRGESAETSSFTLQDELDDLSALIEVAGGEAALYGSSSGGAISLAAAAAGLPVTKLALWEVPLRAELGTDGAEFLAGLRERIGSGDKAGTIEYFMKDMPPEWLAGAKNSPGWPIMMEIGPSLSADSESLAWTQSAPRAELWSGVKQPTLVLLGEQTQTIMTEAADAITANIPGAAKKTIPGANHSWEPKVMAGALAEFFAE